MLLEILLFLLIGLVLGTFCGLAPGIHINLVGTILISLAASSLYFLNPIYLIVLITAMAISQTFIDFIPGIFLGCPDTDSQLSVLPGHQLLKKGHGYYAIMLTSYGCLAGVFLIILTCLPLIWIMPKIYETIHTLIPYILISLSLILISIQRKKFNAFSVFVLTGILGYLILNSNVKEPLLPLLTGLFGTSTLIISLKDKIKIPYQKIHNPKLNKKIIKPILGSIISSPLCAFLPGLGGGQAAIIGNLFVKTKRRGFLILLGATNMLVMGLSFIALYSISKGRTGAAVAIQTLSGNLNKEILILILITILISGIISFIIAKKLAIVFSKIISKINYKYLSLFTLLLISGIVLLVSGFFGFIILVISTLTGIYCISLKTRRTDMMGCLIIPVIIWYLAGF